MSGGKAEGVPVALESTLWQAADKLRNNLDAAEYKHVVLGLIFLKYISDAFDEKHTALVADRKAGADPEDPDEYRAENIFWVPKVARWGHLQGKAKLPTIGKLVDDADAEPLPAGRIPARTPHPHNRRRPARPSSRAACGGNRHMAGSGHDGR